MLHWRVLLDLDGTVAQNAGRRIAAEQFGIVITEEQSGQRLPELLGLTDDEFWAWWHEHEELIYDLAEPLPGAAGTVRALRESGAHIAIVTARRESSRSVTAAWLDRFGIPYDQMVFSAADKVTVARDLGLTVGFEDDPLNALALADLMPVILIENFKNRSQEIVHDQVFRVSGWQEVLPLLRRLDARPA